MAAPFAAPSAEAPVTAALDRIQAAAPARAYTAAPTEAEGPREASRPAPAPDDPVPPRIAHPPVSEAVHAVPPGVAAFGATLVAYVQDETIAALSHLRALGAARSPTEAIRLQFDEMRRATDATLTCWGRLARDASRLIAPR